MLDEKEQKVVKILIKEELKKLAEEESTIVEAHGVLELGIDNYEEALKTILEKL